MEKLFETTIYNSLKLKDFISYWFYQVEKNSVKPSTAATFYELIFRHIIPSLGEYQLSDLNIFILQQFFNEKYEHGRLDHTGGLSYQTISSIYAVLNSALNYAVSNDLIRKNYCSDVRLPRREYKKIRVFTKEEQKKIEKTALQLKNPNKIGIILCLYTGIRIGELCGLHMEDIDLENQILHVQRTRERIKCLDESDKKTMIYEGHPKSHSSIRDIPLPGFLITIIREYIEQYKKEVSPEDPFITGKSGQPMEPRVYQKYFQNVLEKADVDSANFHCLRHTFATRALEAGVDPKTLSELLGHSNPSITMNIYAHSLYEHKFEAMERLEAVYRA